MGDSPSPTRLFDPSNALCALEDLNAIRLGPPLASLVEAWETAWIACLTHSPTWIAAAEDAFNRVVTECREDLGSREWVHRVSGIGRMESTSDEDGTVGDPGVGDATAWASSRGVRR